MNIIMITEKDGANASLAKICDAYIRRGHAVTIYAPYMATNVLRFFDNRVLIYPLDDLTHEIIEKCDVIFTSSVIVPFLRDGKILLSHKPIFVQNYLINKQIYWGGDLCFVPSCGTATTEYEDLDRSPRMEIGEPKYDTINNHKKSSNKLLLIDSGHYPFGIKGKEELADTIINICKEFPKYELCIKPRFLPSDEVVTHKNSIHLYDVIKKQAGDDLPSNLIMLNEHRELMELIEESHTVICMHTTAFVGAYAAGKGLVVLDGLTSDDIYDVRWKVSKRIRDYMLDSGAVINYKEVNKLLPDGVKCSDEYLKFILAEKDCVADKICEVTEYLYDEYYSKGKLPKIRDCSYNGYKEIICADDSITWKDIIKKRCINYFAQRMLILIDFHIKTKLDVKLIKNHLIEIKNKAEISKEIFSETIKKIPMYRDECIIDNAEKMKEDYVDCGILLNAYYLSKKYEEIVTFSPKKTGAYHMFRGFIAYEKADYELALDELKKYANISLTRDYIKEISDMPNNKFKSLYIIVYLLIKTKNMNEAIYYLDKMKLFYDNMYSGKMPKSKLQLQQLVCLHWLDGLAKSKNILPFLKEKDKILIYGAGIITKRLLLNNSDIFNRVIAIVDRNPNIKECCGIEVVTLENVIKYKFCTVVVAVPQEYTNIKNMLLEINPNLNVISVSDIFR